MSVTKLQQAVQFVSEKDYEKAAQLFIEYIDEEPKDPIGYINFANLLAVTNQLEEAERFFLKAIELDEKGATAYYGLGNLYYDQALYTEAEKMFQHCLSLGLEDADVYFMLGMTYFQRKDVKLSLPFLQRATEIEKQPDMLFQYGLALAQTNFVKEAETIWLKVLEYEANHADTLYNLGIIAVQRNDRNLALTYLNKTLQAQPNHTLAQEAKGNLES